MTVLVTGGAGFAGVAVVRELLRRGVDVCVVDDFSVAARTRLQSFGDDIEVLPLDVRHVVPLTEAFRTVAPDCVVHLAALHFIPWCNAEPERAIEINVQGTQNVLSAAADAGVQRVVIASTADVYAIGAEPHSEDDVPAPRGVYGIGKLATEKLLQSWAERTSGTGIAARLFNIYGPGETNPHLLPDICAGLRVSDELQLGNLSPRRDYVYVDDVAEVFASFVSHPDPPRIVNVGTGTSTSVEDVLAMIREMTGRAISVAQDPAKLRPVDRPNLQARPDLLLRTLPDLQLVELRDGLRRLLEAEGLL
ncbi:MAG: NAD-dependent epimerase/dehydratase family protein [Actinomycetes bacterium]